MGVEIRPRPKNCTDSPPPHTSPNQRECQALRMLGQQGGPSSKAEDGWNASTERLVLPAALSVWISVFF